MANPLLPNSGKQPACIPDGSPVFAGKVRLVDLFFWNNGFLS